MIVHYYYKPPKYRKLIMKTICILILIVHTLGFLIIGIELLPKKSASPAHIMWEYRECSQLQLVEVSMPRTPQNMMHASIFDQMQGWEYCGCYQRREKPHYENGQLDEPQGCNVFIFRRPANDKGS